MMAACFPAARSAVTMSRMKSLGAGGAAFSGLGVLIISQCTRRVPIDDETEKRKPIVPAGVPPAVEPGILPGGHARSDRQRARAPTPGRGGKMPPPTAGETPAATHK